MQLEPFTNVEGVLVEMAMPVEKVRENIALARKRNLRSITELPEWRGDAKIAIVGGGPSLKDTLPELRKFERIMAAGSVHDFLMENGIEPTWCVITDPDPIMAEYLRRPGKECTYLVATQCDGRVFEALKGCYVATWNCGGDESTFGLWESGEKLIGGGCTVGTRSMVIAMTFGFFEQDLFGFDSCLRTDEHHAYPFATNMETVGETHEIAVGGDGGRKFTIARYHMGQIFDFKKLLAVYGHRFKVTVHGEGVLAEIMRLANMERLSRAA